MMVQSDDCVYTVYIRTGSIFKAGTDSIMSLTLLDSYGKSIAIPNLETWGGLMGPDYNYFERGNLDIFSGRGKCLDTPVCAMNITSDGTGPHHGWCNNRGGQASPSLWPKTRPNSLEITEPSSPKVTCAGQIKIRPKKTSSNKKWESVMDEEIEMVHNKKNVTKSSVKVENYGLKKDKRHFLNSLRCFGTFKGSESDAITSIDDKEEQETQVSIEDSELNGKWFMVLQDNNNNNKMVRVAKEEERVGRDGSSVEYGCDQSVVPPSDALLLMRCRSAPTKNLLVEKEEEEEELVYLDQEEKTDSSLILMKCYGPADLLKVNSDIQNENRLVGGMKDPLSRSRRWRRS
ncbi:Plat domain-containing protein [Thalictrum thalictroides]|uniref:Plat domain-containing protein n=1 Tax=Thalictrum thalictroides TaxID=46969 RepID=A0A7J6W0H0_THATH|nr:Plat domain-containing protein [Thalictrum thalictroides]